MNRNGGCGSVLLAFTAAAIAVWAVERLWPFLLLGVAIVAGLAGAHALTRTPQPVPLDASKATGKWAQRTRMTDRERDQVMDALRDAAADGRLDAEELEDRLVVAVRAKRWGEIKPLVEDLGL